MNDSDFEISFSSPTGPSSLLNTPAAQKGASKQPPKPTNPTTTDPASRDARLQAELVTLQRMNHVVESLLTSLTRARANMHTVHATVAQSSQLLDTWTRILSQTEYNQRLILDPAWQGASHDLTEAENAAATAQRDRERRQAEEVRRQAAAEEARQRRVEEEERRAAEAPKTPVRGGASRRATAGRARGTGTGKAGLQRAASQSQGPSAGARLAPTEDEERKAAAQRARARGRAAIMHYGRVRGKK